MSGTGNLTNANILATGNQNVDGLLYGTAWLLQIDFSFPSNNGEYGAPYGSGNFVEPNSFSAVSNDMKDTARFILDKDFGNSANDGFSLEGFTNLSVSETTSTNANLRFAQSDDPGELAHAYYPTTHEAGGDSWFGTGQYVDPIMGNYEWMSILHETGHALGLSHSHESENGFGAVPAQFDSMEYTVMSYRSYAGAPFTYHNETFGYAQTFMMLDIAALQHMYGADYTTNSGNTVYKWNPGSGDTLVNGSVAIDPGGNRIFATIWDGGGKDTYDLSSYADNLQLDLRAGASSEFSDTQIAGLGDGHFAAGNIYNALLFGGDKRSLIENAIGGTGDDSILGNSAKNLLEGGEGSDHLVGFKGNDKLKGGEGADELFGSKGDDKLFGGVGRDTLEGGKGNDLIKGQKGNDIISGGLGKDFLYGGNGSDEFVFDDNVDFSKSSSIDIIKDFEIGEDTIRITNGGFDSGDIGGDITIEQLTSTKFKVTVDSTHVIKVFIDGGGTLTADDFAFGLVP